MLRIFSLVLMLLSIVGLLIVLPLTFIQPKKQTTDQPDIELHQKCLYPTILVLDEQEDSGGSAFIVKSVKVGDEWHNIVIGAAHTSVNNYMIASVCKYKNWSEIEGYDKHSIFCYARNTKSDLAISFFVSDHQMPTVELNLSPDLFIGTPVFHIGYGLMYDARLDYGQVTQPKTAKPNHFKGMIRTNVFTYFGDSGGALFSTKDKKVVGVCKAIDSKGIIPIPQISYYTPISLFKTWDDESNNAFESVYKESAEMPVLPFMKLKLHEYSYEKLPD